MKYGLCVNVIRMSSYNESASKLPRTMSYYYIF